MSTNLTLKCTKISKEKSWQNDENNKPLNRHTIEFEVGYDETSEKEPRIKSFSGSTMKLETLDKKIYDQYKIGEEYTLVIKK